MVAAGMKLICHTYGWRDAGGVSALQLLQEADTTASQGKANAVVDFGALIDHASWVDAEGCYSGLELLQEADTATSQGEPPPPRAAADVCFYPA
jgi:hypothetical protein